MRSIRGRLTRSAVLSVAAVLLAWGAALYFAARATLVRQFDVALAAKARVLGTLLGHDGERFEFDFAGEAMPEFAGGPDPEYFQLWTGEGTLLETSESLEQPALPLLYGPVEAPRFWDLLLPDGRSGRAVGVQMPVDADDQRPEPVPQTLPLATLVLARSRERLDGTLALALAALILSGGVALLLVARLLQRAVTTSLEPLVAIGRQVERVEARSLSQRLPTDRVPAELETFVAKLNELLERLDGAFARERRMTANVAHELRTPLAELRAATEVACRWPDDPQLVDHALKAAFRVSERMGGMVGALLRLFSLQTGRDRLQKEPFDVTELVQEVLAPLLPRAEERKVTVRGEAPPAPLHGDRGLLAVALRNLLANAVDFTPPGGCVEWSLAAEDGRVRLCVTNPAPKLDEHDLERLGEPFWQKDAARSEAGHSGLGLPLALSIAEALGAELGFALHGGRLHATLGLPAGGET